MKRRLLMAAFLLGSPPAAVVAVLWAGSAALAYKAPCSQPCADPRPGAPAKSTCSPVRLSLELEKPEAKANWSYTLWYRLTLKNTSCRVIEIDAEHFVADVDSPFSEDNIGYKKIELGYGISFRIWGPDGKRIERFGDHDKYCPRGQQWCDYPSDYKFPKTYSPLEPYQIDRKAQPWIDAAMAADERERAKRDTGVPRWMAEKYPKMAKEDPYEIPLLPGQTITTNPSRLNPRFLRDSEIEMKIAMNREVGTPEALEGVKAWEEVRRASNEKNLLIANPPKAPQPPPGYRILRDYAFKKPGTYRIQAVLSDNIAIRDYHRPFEEFVPRWVKWLMNKAYVFFDLNLFPVRESSEVERLVIESEPLEFEVKP